MSPRLKPVVGAGGSFSAKALLIAFQVSGPTSPSTGYTLCSF